MIIDTERGSSRILRLIATIVCVVYGVLLARVQPYRSSSDFDFALISNLLLTLFLIIGIVLHRFPEEGDLIDGESTCETLFGLLDSYNASMLALLLIASMLLFFCSFL